MDNSYDDSNVNPQEEIQLSKTEKAERASHDVAEIAARGLGRYYGGTAGGAAVDLALRTKKGQNILGKASKTVAHSPGMKGKLARSYGFVDKYKGVAHEVIDNIGATEYDSEDTNGNNNTGKVITSGIWKKMPLKVKLIIIGVVLALIALVIFLIIFITPLMELGYINIDGVGGSTNSGSSSGYSSISDNVSHWWPVGGTQNGVNIDDGTPVTTTITSYYESKEEFRTNVHGGIDVGNSGNGPGIINIIATKSGKVVYPTSTSQIVFADNGYYGNPDGAGFGNYVMIEHPDGTTTLYAHLSQNSITVISGETVVQGQVIGKMGNSGSSTGTHLHFEVRVNGNRVDPMNYVSDSNTRPNLR